MEQLLQSVGQQPSATECEVTVVLTVERFKAQSKLPSCPPGPSCSIKGVKFFSGVAQTKHTGHTRQRLIAHVLVQHLANRCCAFGSHLCGSRVFNRINRRMKRSCIWHHKNIMRYSRNWEAIAAIVILFILACRNT